MTKYNHKKFENNGKKRHRRNRNSLFKQTWK